MALTKISTGMLKQDAASSDLNIDAGTLYLDVSNNRVGVNKTSPSQTLHVNGMSQFDNTMLFGSRGRISWGSMGGGTGFGIRAASGNALSLVAMELGIKQLLIPQVTYSWEQLRAMEID